MAGGEDVGLIWCEIRLKPFIALPENDEKRLLEEAGVMGMSDSAEDTEAEREGPAAE